MPGILQTKGIYQYIKIYLPGQYIELSKNTMANEYFNCFDISKPIF